MKGGGRQGTGNTGNNGDPAMTLDVPTEQFRSDYLFHAPVNYTANYVNVVAPLSAAVMLDGQMVMGLAPIGASGLGVARVPLTNGPGGDGNHHISSAQPFGISVYGYGLWTSYWYPGGLDLQRIPD
jgi:hypothetical protein